MVLTSTIIYTDGACSGNPGPGGWAAIVITPAAQVRELVGAESQTTNNRMEMLATIKALELIRGDSSVVEIFTDSVYVIRGITQWVFGWKKRGWKTAEGQPVLNQDLWEILLALTSSRGKGGIQWSYCRGHQGTVGNERCDELAVQASKGLRPQAYQGSLKNYQFPVMPPPKHQPLPEMKSVTEKPKVFSYLSYLPGLVYRHKDWASCEKRVKGKSGAKFKKAMSSEDEIAILKTWGLDPRQVVIKDEER